MKTTGDNSLGIIKNTQYVCNLIFINPPGQTPSGHRHPPQQMATAADGTHPTGMHSCFLWLQKVVEVSKKYLPYMSSGFDSLKLNLNFADGFDYMGKHQGEFDIIITDSSDPIGVQFVQFLSAIILNARILNVKFSYCCNIAIVYVTCVITISTKFFRIFHPFTYFTQLKHVSVTVVNCGQNIHRYIFYFVRQDLPPHYFKNRTMS